MEAPDFPQPTSIITTNSMANTILLQTISGNPDHSISMSNGQFARTLSIGTTWTTIRVGVRWHMDNTGADLTGTPRLAVGMCAGTTNIFGDATCDHFVGGLSNAASFTNNAGDFYFGTPLFVPAKKVVSTLTTGTAFGNGVITTPASIANRVPMFIDLTKGSPNFSLRQFILTSGTDLGDVSLSDFLGLMESPAPARTGYTYHAAQTIAVDEATDGYLDSINIAWDRAAAKVQVCDIAVARLA